ncbi:bile acid:sodium symporter family protein [Austwickia chelonae]|uniref:bile acid:sodium symporter family protein n=1 Tax=Austwickia chelonae TaxID=100225 RepID=UPI000E21EF8B|nr:bile acid:sodium symporter family protein [Austwickia chelonae]
MRRLAAALGQVKFDGFIVAILTAVLVASVLPASGRTAGHLDIGIQVAIAVLFFMYGGRLEPRQALRGLTHWRLHLLILGFTYVAFPLVGVLCASLLGLVLPPALVGGVLYLCLIPSTVQSSITFTSIAKGNVAGAVVSASVSNLAGVLLTPALVLLVMSGSSGVALQPEAVVDLVLQILLPFVCGQLSRRWTGGWLAANGAWLKYVDRGVIVAVVYSAFSRGMREGMWTQISGKDLVALTLVMAALLTLMLQATRTAAEACGFNREDKIAVQFCGTKKSLATGLPMALVLFPGQPVGLMVLPLMLFHQLQLMACAVIAQRYARESVHPGSGRNDSGPSSKDDPGSGGT